MYIYNIISYTYIHCYLLIDLFLYTVYVVLFFIHVGSAQRDLLYCHVYLAMLSPPPTPPHVRAAAYTYHHVLTKSTWGKWPRNGEHAALVFKRPCHFVVSLGKPKLAKPGHICLCTNGILSALLYLSIRFGTCSDMNRRVQETLAALLPSVLNLRQGEKKHLEQSNKQQLPIAANMFWSMASRCLCGSNTISSSDSAFGSADRPHATGVTNPNMLQGHPPAFSNAMENSIHQVRLARACLQLRRNKVFHPNLVGGFNPSEKYDRQIGNLPQIGVKIKKMFETTSQKVFHPNCERVFLPFFSLAASLKEQHLQFLGHC